jgi:mediator of RNA polymerase II transcription subunit 14
VVSRVMEENIELTTLIHYILQKSYGDLTQLTELLPRKTDIDRKLDIVQYARQTRQLLIRLLSLVKWAKTAGPVRQCSDVSRQINHQSWVFIDTADQLANLARNTLHQAAYAII